MYDYDHLIVHDNNTTTPHTTAAYCAGLCILESDAGTFQSHNTMSKMKNAHCAYIIYHIRRWIMIMIMIMDMDMEMQNAEHAHLHPQLRLQKPPALAFPMSLFLHLHLHWCTSLYFLHFAFFGFVCAGSWHCATASMHAARCLDGNTQHYLLSILCLPFSR